MLDFYSSSGYNWVVLTSPLHTAHVAHIDQRKVASLAAAQVRLWWIWQDGAGPSHLVKRGLRQAQTNGTTGTVEHQFPWDRRAQRTRIPMRSMRARHLAMRTLQRTCHVMIRKSTNSVLASLSMACATTQNVRNVIASRVFLRQPLVHERRNPQLVRRRLLHFVRNDKFPSRVQGMACSAAERAKALTCAASLPSCVSYCLTVSGRASPCDRTGKPIPPPVRPWDRRADEFRFALGILPTGMKEP